MDNAVISALVQRRSVRAYKPEQITDDELRTVLEAGTWAPPVTRSPGRRTITGS